MPSYYIGAIPYSAESHLRHFGILGMKWGVRRYQNPDGTLTAEGKARYSKEFVKEVRGGSSRASAYTSKAGKKIGNAVASDPEMINAAKRTQESLDIFNKERVDAESKFYRTDNQDYRWMAKKEATRMQKNGWEGSSISELTEMVMQTDLGQNLLEDFMKTDRGKARFPKLYSAEKSSAKNFNVLREKTKKAVADILGDLGNERVSYNSQYSKYDGTVQDLLSDAVENHILSDIVTGRFR